jgi:uncharacterized membrane protein (UPF0127 family)
MRIRRTLLLITSLVSASGCEDGAPPFVSPIPFDTASVTVAAGGSSARLLVEVARTPEQKALGLGIRPSLDEGSGMIFPYDTEQPGDAAYWMWRMHVPLDIAFLDSAGVVLRILAAEPCTAVYVEGCPSYAPGVPYWSVLEANQGWFAENGMGEGAVVTLEE